MYKLLLLLGVVSLLALLAWHYLSRRQALAREAGQGTGRAIQAVDAAGDLVARLLKGERKEDKPCLTPIDCVQANRCAGRCGYR